MKRVRFIMPYLGPLPPWFDFFLRSCAHNPSLEWWFFVDAPSPPRRPANVRFIPFSLEELQARARAALGLDLLWRDGYKLVDVRPAFPALFPEALEGVDYWGFGDVDVIYGELWRALTDEALSRDVVSFHHDRLSGHLCLFANTDGNRALHERIPDFRARASSPEWQGLDDALNPVLDFTRGHFVESFNTPGADRPWRDGRFVFPSSWRWRAGVLTNDLDGDLSLPYLHFMVWRGGRWGHLHGGGQWERLERIIHTDASAPEGFRITAEGFGPP